MSASTRAHVAFDFSTEHRSASTRPASVSWSTVPDRGDGRLEPTFAVNAGSYYSFVDPAGMTWEADRAYVNGRWGYVGGTPRLRHHRIYGTDDDPVTQHGRIHTP